MRATPLDEQLVAYLDGELDAESSRRMDELLATDADVRRRLQEMERTWDLLDDLDAAAGRRPLHPDYAGDGGRGGAEGRCRDQGRGPPAPAATVADRRRPAGGGAAGFLAVALLVTIRIGNCSKTCRCWRTSTDYRPIDSIEFLQLLDKEKLFSVAGEDASHAAPAKAEVPVDQRRQLVESMNPGEKERPAAAPGAICESRHDRQQQLRQLDEELQTAPERRASPPPHAAATASG